MLCLRLTQSCVTMEEGRTQHHAELLSILHVKSVHRCPCRASTGAGGVDGRGGGSRGRQARGSRASGLQACRAHAGARAAERSAAPGAGPAGVQCVQACLRLCCMCLLCLGRPEKVPVQLPTAAPCMAGVTNASDPHITMPATLCVPHT